MKRNTKTTSWIIAAIILLLACIIVVHYLVNSPFEETRIYPDDSREHPKDTIFTVNGIAFKMIGVKGGRIKCKGFRKTIELKDFYISETEVTQELWMSVMGDNPSVHKDSALCPVENIDLVECLDFVHKLDSISGINFHIHPILSGYMLPVLVVWMRIPHILMMVWVGIRKIQAIPLILLSKSSQIS